MKPKDNEPIDQLAARWYSVKDLAEHFSCHRNSIWRWVNAGLLPAPEKPMPHSTRWWGPTVNAHRAAQREKSAA